MFNLVFGVLGLTDLALADLTPADEAPMLLDTAGKRDLKTRKKNNETTVIGEFRNPECKSKENWNQKV